MKKLILAASLALLSSNVLAKVDINLINESIPKFQTINIVKEKKLYFLTYKSFGLYNNKGEQISFNDRARSYQLIKRTIKMPIKIELVEKSGFGNTIQFLGFGDDDLKTGSFKNLSNLRLGDLFTTFNGTSTNIGLTFIGGGYTTMTAANGATLKEGNGSILFIGPSGTPVGLNAGIHHINFDMTISSSLRAVAVEYESEKFVDGIKVDIQEETKVETLEDVSQLELLNS